MTHNVGNRAVQLAAVVVHETNEVIQLVVRCKLRAFPDLALVTLAVAYGNVNTARTILRTIAERRADGFAHALTERTGRQVNADGLAAVGMRREIRVRLVERVRALHRVISLETERRIHDRAAVSLGQNEPVAVLPAGILRVDMHNLAIQHRHSIRHRHRAAHMAEAARRDHLERFQTDFRRKHTQLVQFLLIHCFPP